MHLPSIPHVRTRTSLAPRLRAAPAAPARRGTSLLRAAALAATVSVTASSLHAQSSLPATLPAVAASPFESPEPPLYPGLLIPVDGARPEQLRDTYHAGRGAGREHLAIDIHAPRGTPVRAAADGRVLRLHTGDRGGISLYQLGADGRTRYYYAHLDRYAEGVAEGRYLRRGEVIGYVGDTGNAAPGDTHLHFSISLLDDVRRWWEGSNVNPYPLLRASSAERRPALPRRSMDLLPPAHP
ncbi:MAG TPA: M23 family metallopeptidase [Longimicrobiaceae bacterium]|nr:M23 family metallopeptidase [Longimicrobiaceae bacterium]